MDTSPVGDSGWFRNTEPRRRSLPVHDNSVVTTVLIHQEYIITASDNHSICVHALETGALVHKLNGHEGGIWAVVVHGHTLVSGSTDRTIRIWDLTSGLCKHVFGGHTSTVRCLSLAQPNDVGRNEEPLIISGSRDHTLKVWRLPSPSAVEYNWSVETSGNDEISVCA